MPDSELSPIDHFLLAHSDNPAVREAYERYRRAIDTMRLCEGAACRSWGRGFETYALERLQSIAARPAAEPSHEQAP